MPLRKWKMENDGAALLDLQNLEGKAYVIS